MIAPDLPTCNPDTRLIEPDIERDAKNGVRWLSGESGRHTLKMMGIADEHNKDTTLEDERARVRDFINRKDQLNWMVDYKGHVVGSVWVDLKASEHLPGPSVHIMVGDPGIRGKGVGRTSLDAVLDYLGRTGATTVYSRYITANNSSANMLAKAGFSKLGEVYTDKDRLEWQNVQKTIGL